MFEFGNLEAIDKVQLDSPTIEFRGKSYVDIALVGADCELTDYEGEKTKISPADFNEVKYKRQFPRLV